MAGINVDQDIEFQRKSWAAQRAGWTTMGLLLLLALLGLFGDGPLSKAKAANQNIKVEYSRFIRYESPESLKLTINKPSLEKISLWIETSYLDKIKIQEVDPDSNEISLQNNKTVYSYELHNHSDSVSFTIEYTAQNPGLITGAVGIIDGPEIKINQFVYP